MIKGLVATLQQVSAQRNTRYTVKAYYTEEIVEQNLTPPYHVVVVATLEEAEQLKEQFEKNEDYSEVYIDEE